MDTSLLTRNFDRAFLWIGGVSLLLLAGVTAALVLFAVKYRRGKATTTSQRGHNTALEITWTVLPTLLVIWMFYVGYEGFLVLRNAPDDALLVRVTGRRWVWTFDYPDAGVAGATEMVVPVGRAVRLELSAPPDDVLHSFYLPDFREKEDVLPGRKTRLWFPAEQEGVYDIFCAEFCGKDHSQMRTVLRVVAPKEYAAWLRKQAARRLKPVDVATLLDPSKAVKEGEDWAADAKTVYRTFCASCHGEAGDGSGLPGEARDFRTLDGWKNGARVTDIYRTLEKGIPGTSMNAFPNLSAWERVILAHHVRGFLKDAPADTPETAKALVEERSLDKIPEPRETIPVERAMELLERESR